MTLGSRHRLRHGLFWAAAALVVAALLVHFAHTVFGFASPERDFLIQEWIYNFITGTAAVAVLARAALRRDDRIAWALIGGGLLAWAASDMYWTLEYANLEEPPFPNVSDVGYLMGYVFVLAGVAGLVRGYVRHMSALVWVDLGIAALCVGAIGATVLMGYVLENTTGTTLEVIVAIAYPALDLATLALAAAALALTGWRPGRALGLVALGIIATGVGDAVYTYQSLAGTYTALSWNNFLWPLGTIVIVLGALQAAQARREVPRAESWRSFATPAIFALAILTLLVLTNDTGGDGAVVEVLTGATLIAIVVRLTLTFRENRRLVGALQRDALTRLGNRSKLLLDLERVFGDSEAPPHVLVFLDLDGFKSYNDSFGHPAGDALLTRLAGRLDASVEGRGSAYRLGGDEFAVLAPGSGAESAGFVQSVGEALSEHGEGFRITSSLGTAELPLEASSTSNALQLADQRMYDHKDSRRPTPGGEVEAVLARILQQRSPELGVHGDAVAKLAVATAKRLGMPEGEQQAIGRAAEFHDIGKVAIPDAILQKPGPLTEDEWEFMRQHTILGERILAAAPSLSATGGVVRSSHERWDGTGYPDRLAGDRIPLAARIIFACDAYDAMTSKRPYAGKREHEAALAELRAKAGSMFDPDVVEAFIETIGEGDPRAIDPRAAEAETTVPG